VLFGPAVETRFAPVTYDYRIASMVAEGADAVVLGTLRKARG
jgi:hypothetical protein